jgi:serine phosphatase RsbU (regulator of sigma subunit)
MKNIKNLGEDKYMTLTVLAVHRDGKFSFSGLHQDIIIYRAASSTMEIVETSGIWIGLLDNIKNIVSDSTLAMDHGDVLLLFTDGITEAVYKNQGSLASIESDMFGQEKLGNLFITLGTKPVDLIRQGILDSLADYLLNDDITLVIIKRNPER